MSARLADPAGLPEEGCSGECPVRFRLCFDSGERRVEVDQLGRRLILASGLWDRLYAELQLVLAHGRHVDRTRPDRALAMTESPRLLH